MTRDEITCFIADDHVLLCQSIGQVLEIKSNHLVRFTGYATTESDLIQYLKGNKPSVLLLDISIPGKTGLTLLTEIKAAYPNLKVIMLTMHNNQQYLNYCLSQGAKGYVLKNSGVETLIAAIKKVYYGETFIDPSLTQPKLTIAEQDKKDRLKNSYNLTSQEAEVLILIAQGKTNKEISRMLFRSEHTIKTHRRNLKAKLKVRSTADLVRLVVE
ncbi:DNA-binding response regulator [Sphingobacteriales bacterium UPWRP_1]|nr:hypothetical protein BVG80_08805 [Sphingobacteriales bacterium TSM_CSM]PSJ78524.1 DNA-binding response regulator [Sphingobacteriales bacterium UPWRP_1]